MQEKLKALWSKFTKQPTKAYVDPMLVTLDRILTEEVNAINALYAENGINTEVDVEKSYFSDTGNFVRYKMKRGDRIGKIKGLAGDLSELLAELRGRKTTVRFGENGLAFDVPFPLETKVLEWEDADLTALRPFQALLGMNYTEMCTAILDYTDEALSNVMLTGTTGSGKTRALLTLIASMCYSTSPDKLTFVVLDAKPDEDFEPLRILPHVRMVRNIGECVAAIRSVREELDRRGQSPDKRKVILVIDEYAELINKVTREFGAQTFQAMESDLGSIAQAGRSKNIHIFFSTQKAVVTIVDTVFKGNMPYRIGGKVTTMEESKVAMGKDSVGCETLPGKGSFYFTTGSEISRVQSYLIPKNMTSSVMREVSERWRGSEVFSVTMVELGELAANSNGSIMTTQHKLQAWPDLANRPQPATIAKLPLDIKAEFVVEHLDMALLFNSDGSKTKNAAKQIVELFFGEGAHGGSTQHNAAKAVLDHVAAYYYAQADA